MSEIINLTFLENLTGNDKNKMITYMNMFLSLTPQSIKTMYACYENKDWGMLKTIAHSLKPQFTYMGIATLKDTILKLEEDAMIPFKNEGTKLLIDQINEICLNAFVELNNYIQKNS